MENVYVNFVISIIYKLRGPLRHKQNVTDKKKPDQEVDIDYTGQNFSQENVSHFSVFRVN